MKITLIVKKNEKKPGLYDENQLTEALKRLGHEVRSYDLDQLTINFCNGCWSCWYKTPGLCSQKDDMEQIYQSYLQSDLVIHFTPLKAGFIDARLKTVNDRSVPLLLPYVTLVNGECHHVKRYDHYPAFALIINENQPDSMDLEITRELYIRFTINMKTRLSYFGTTQHNMEETINELSHI